MARGAGQKEFGGRFGFSVADVIRGDIPQLPQVGMYSNMSSRDSMMFVLMQTPTGYAVRVDPLLSNERSWNNRSKPRSENWITTETTFDRVKPILLAHSDLRLDTQT